MLDAEARILLDLMEEATKAGRPKLETLPHAVGRAAVDKMSEDSEADPPQVGDTVDGVFAGPGGPIKYRRYLPLGVTLALTQGNLPTLIYYHGGGFVIGTIETHDSTCRRLANKSRCQVISIDYRLSPEHPFPAPIDDGIAAFRHIRDHADTFGADPARLAVGGDSAGGAVAAVVCQAMRDAKEAGPAFQMLIYPATDSSKESGSRQQFAEGYFLTKGLMDWFWKAYVPAGTDLSDLRLSPLLAKDFTGLPPAFVLTAGHDPLRDEGRAYANRLIDAGVKTTYVNYPGTIHGFFSLTRFLQQGLKANDEAAAVMGAFFGT
ncbi:MAG: alpha/beta hydrolase [Reyranella sp.]|uniref:alpha/beta hydrolase n=1 Tax=Reyranella sp. TaxID=1929291 RepID=UPI0012203380|nr:alpha/beta hydrolase [Reyranella sp.]TAJ91161.1 MAG: alpha/beta hydrolase [Reyranella sp.]TBR24988.1 MAG: alpha/beta hydrolase [Reyranella sp.]